MDQMDIMDQMDVMDQMDIAVVSLGRDYDTILTKQQLCPLRPFGPFVLIQAADSLLAKEIIGLKR